MPYFNLLCPSSWDEYLCEEKSKLTDQSDVRNNSRQNFWLKFYILCLKSRSRWFFVYI